MPNALTWWIWLLVTVDLNTMSPPPLASRLMPLQLPWQPEPAVAALPIVFPLMVPMIDAPAVVKPVLMMIPVPLPGVPKAEPKIWLELTLYAVSAALLTPMPTPLLLYVDVV